MNLTQNPAPVQFDDFPPSSAPDLRRIGALLVDRHYSAHAIAVIVRYADQLGTLEGLEELGYLVAEDRADADAALEAAWDAVPQTSARWDDDAARWGVAGAVTPGRARDRAAARF